MLRGKFASTNQKHYPDLGSDTSSVWNFCRRFSDIISQANVNDDKHAMIHVTNGSKLRRHQYRFSYNVINVQHLLSTIFVQKTTLSNPFPKNAQIVNLKNPDLGLIGFTFFLEEDRLLIPSQVAFMLLRFSSKKEL